MANTIFDSLTAPNGAAFDSIGNLYLTTLTSGSNSLPGIPPSLPTIFKIDASGNVVSQLLTGSFANPKLEFVPELNLLVSIEENGQLLFIDPATLSITGEFNLNQIQLDASAVLDITTRQVSNFSGSIPSGASTYGDFDVRVTDNSIQFFISGLSQAQVLPFVARLTVVNGTLTESRVLFSSSADAQSLTPQTPRLNRGIAVNQQGTVLTTLPLAATQGPLDFTVAFNADIEVADGVGGNEFLIVNNQVDIYSQGLTTDATGNFYITTNSVGSGVLGVAGEGALIVVPPDLSRFTFAQGIGLPGSSFSDVAIDPTTGVPFVTVDASGLFPSISGGDDGLIAFPEASGQQLASNLISTDSLIAIDDPITGNGLIAENTKELTSMDFDSLTSDLLVSDTLFDNLLVDLLSGISAPISVRKSLSITDDAVVTYDNNALPDGWGNDSLSVVAL